MVPLESLGTVSYSCSIVTMALSCMISEIKRDIGRNIAIFHTLCIRRPVRGPVGALLHRAFGVENLIAIEYRRVTDRRTDGRADGRTDLHLATA